MLIESRNLIAALAMMASLLLRADMILAFSFKEHYPDTILTLENAKAQCTDASQRAIFDYAKFTKLLAWYRDGNYSNEIELKLRNIMYRIATFSEKKEKKTTNGKPKAISILGLPREDYPEFSEWIGHPLPVYSKEECAAMASKAISNIGFDYKKIPETFPELRKYIAMLDPDELLSIAKQIGTCDSTHSGKYGVYVDATSFEAWISNRFHMFYGDRENMSRPLYEQFQREAYALGGMAGALTKFSSPNATTEQCEKLKDRQLTYETSHLGL